MIAWVYGLGLFVRRLAGFILLVAWAWPALGQDITLTSRDGGLTVSGMLLKYDGEFYHIRSEYGDLTLDGSGVVCSGPGCPDLSAYVAQTHFAGPGFLAARLFPDLIEAFARIEGYSVDVVAGDEGKSFFLRERQGERIVARFVFAEAQDDEAFARLIAGKADAVLTSRSVLPGEVELARAAGKGRLDTYVQEHVVALDAIVAIVANSNPVTQIGFSDLSGVFGGVVEDWTSLGGANAPIELHIPEQNLAAHSVLLERLMLGMGRSYPAKAITHEDLSSLTDAVSGNPFAIGVTRLSAVGGTRALEVFGACGFRSVARSDSLKAEDFPLPAPIFLYHRSGRLPAVTRDFVRFLATPAAQIAVLQSGYVDQTFGRISADRQGDRLSNAILNAGGGTSLADLKQLVSAMSGRDRLSVTFRFRPSSTELDPQSRSNIRLLARAIESGTLNADAMTFVGFSDGIGDAGRNRELSMERAEEVRQQVLQAAPTADLSQLSVRAMGLGEVMPLACDDEAWGRNLNRRVEVWVE